MKLLQSKASTWKSGRPRFGECAFSPSSSSAPTGEDDSSAAADVDALHSSPGSFKYAGRCVQKCPSRMYADVEGEPSCFGGHPQLELLAQALTFVGDVISSQMHLV